MAFKDPAGVYKTTYQKDFAVLRTKTHWGILLASLFLLFISPTFLPTSILVLMTSMGCIIIATLGIQILNGYAGQVSIGHGAFFATGAYAAAILMVKLHFPFFLAVLSAGIIAGVVGLVVGTPGLRLKGFYIAMSTLAGHAIIIYVIIRWRSLTGGNFGHDFPAGSFLGYSLANERNQFLFVMAVLVLSTYAATNIMRTMTGRAFIAVRDNDLAANVMGINVWVVKLKAFFIGCFFAGIGGALWGHWAGHSPGRACASRRISRTPGTCPPPSACATCPSRRALERRASGPGRRSASASRD